MSWFIGILWVYLATSPWITFAVDYKAAKATNQDKKILSAGWNKSSLFAC